MKKIDYVKILGSIAPYSTKKNNCPGYLVKFNDCNILLDCGPGICKELKVPEDFYKLHIFISHFHKDHYLDLLTVAYASYVYNSLGMLNEKIKVYIPKIDSNDSEYDDYILIKNLKEQYFEIIEYDENSLFSINNIKISFMKNCHSIKTYTTKLEFENKSLVYAADLGYDSKYELVKFSKNSNLLLIESSYIISDDINSNYHLYAYQAAEIAKEANISKLILTHFWPGHKDYLYLREAKSIFKNVKLSKKGKKFKL